MDTRKNLYFYRWIKYGYGKYTIIIIIIIIIMNNATVLRVIFWWMLWVDCIYYLIAAYDSQK